MGFGLKNQNRAVVAQFRVHRAKRRMGTVHKGGVVVRTRCWWWWWGVAFANARRERGLRLKKLKPSRRGLISGVPCKTVKGDGGVVWCGGGGGGAACL
jgi:hypothetical protein